MANREPNSDSPRLSQQQVFDTDPHQWMAFRVAGVYLIAGLLWIGLSDLTLAETGGLTTIGFLVSAGKGAAFILVSSGLVFWLCRREYRSTLRSMALLRAVVEGTSDAVFAKDRDGRYLLVNSAAAQFFGKPVAEVLGRDDRQLLDIREGERLMASDRKIMEGGAIVTLDETLTSSGIVRTFQATKAPFFDAAGTVAGIIGISRDVSDRVRIESALRETDSRLREAQRIARLGSWSWEPPTNLVWWSDAEFELFGADPKAVRPSFEAFLALLHPDDRKVAVERVEAMLAGANEFDNEMRIARGDGTWMWIRSLARATRNANGTLVRVEGTDQDITDQRQAREVLALDITDRKRAEVELKASERRLRLALEAAGAIAFSWDIRSNLVTRYFSKEPALPATAEKVGTLDEVRSRVHRDDLAEFDNRLAAALAAGNEYRNAYRVVRPDGTSVNLEEYGFLDRAADGSPLHLTGMSIDVTERVAATESLRVSEERLRVALKGARGGVWDWHLVTGVVWWSPEMYDLMGAPADVDIGEAGAVGLIHEDDRQLVQAAVADAISRRLDYHCEFRVHGGARWLSSHARLSCDTSGTPVRLVGITWDITDRVGADEALRSSESR